MNRFFDSFELLTLWVLVGMYIILILVIKHKKSESKSVVMIVGVVCKSGPAKSESEKILAK